MLLLFYKYEFVINLFLVVTKLQKQLTAYLLSGLVKWYMDCTNVELI